MIGRNASTAPLIKPFLGAREYLQGQKRFILDLHGVAPNVLKTMPDVIERIKLVRENRLASDRQVTRELADTPTEFAFKTIPSEPFLMLPSVSSERRDYVPIGFATPPTIPSNLVNVLLGATLGHFSILISSIHMAWMRTIGGKLKSDYRYTIGLVYNTFPMPKSNDLSALEPCAQAILDARAKYPDASLADLYDPDIMPADLRRAHMANDRAVDRLYRRAAFKSERDRVEHLFQLYEKMTDPLLAKPAKKGRRRRAS